MTNRRLRESPRMVAATVLVGGLLVLIGILVASTTAGGTTHTSAAAPPATPAAQAPKPPKASPVAQAPKAAQASPQQVAALRSDQATIAQLRASLRSQGNQLSSAAAHVRAAQANARCWHQKVIHPIKTRGVRCALPA